MTICIYQAVGKNFVPLLPSLLLQIFYGKLSEFGITVRFCNVKLLTTEYTCTCNQLYRENNSKANVSHALQV